MRSSTTAPTWVKTGVWHPGDEVGDDQIGDSYTATYHLEERPNSVVSVTYYIVITGEDQGEPRYGVRRRTEWAILDADGNPEWSEVHDEVAGGLHDHPTYKAAWQEMVELALAHEPSEITWDGVER